MTDWSGPLCPPLGFTKLGSPWNLTGSVSVPNATECKIEKGAEIVGNSYSLQVQAGGTLTGIGTDATQRDVVLTNVYVTFDAGSSGELRNCTLSGGYVYIIDASPTIAGCTLEASTPLYVGGSSTTAPAQPLIQGNTPPTSWRALATATTRTTYSCGVWRRG